MRTMLGLPNFLRGIVTLPQSGMWRSCGAELPGDAPAFFVFGILFSHILKCRTYYSCRTPATNVNGAFKILKASFFIHITQTGRLSEFDITHYICYNINLIGGGAQSAHWIVNLWWFG